MPSNATARIKSARKRRPLASAVCAVFVVVVVVGVVFWPRTRYVQLNFPDRAFTLEVASSKADRLKGLSGRTTLPHNRGMLFPFEDAGRPCMWMKDMRFPLDMLWLDAQQRVVHMARNVSPLTYPVVFCPRAPAKYVVELSAGQTEASHIYVGERLSF